MDEELALADLRKALALLPRDVVKGLLGLIFNNLLSLVGAWPQLRALMEPHVKAGMLAHGAGILDMDKLQKGVKEIVAEYMS